MNGDFSAKYMADTSISSENMADTSISSITQDYGCSKSITYSSNVTIHKLWTLPIPISDPSSSIHYKFSTLPGDISFQIIFRPNDGEEVELHLMERCPSHIGVSKGTISPLKKYGVLYFNFDNSYSWLQRKELSYTIEIRHVGQILKNHNL